MESKSDPVHNCPVQGENTPLVGTLNVETNERGWTCIWCAMAAHIQGKPMPKFDVRAEVGDGS